MLSLCIWPCVLLLPLVVVTHVGLTDGTESQLKHNSLIGCCLYVLYVHNQSEAIDWGGGDYKVFESNCP